MNNDVVIVKLDRPRELRFNHTALKTLVSLTGMDLEDIDEAVRPGNFEMIENLAYCGLLKDAKEHGEELTPERTIELLDQAPVYAHALEKVFQAWYAAFGSQLEPAGNQPQPAEKPARRNSTGKKASE